MARVEEFCIDRFEAHLIRADAEETPHSAYERPKSGTRYRAVATRGQVPQAYLSRHEASAACRHAGKRLCRADEWHRACGGSAHFTYPYGNDVVPGRCNTGKQHLLPKLFGRKTPFTLEYHYNNPRVNQEPGFLARTGEYAECKNDYGIYDMVGNLHEWVSDAVSNALADRIPIPYGKHKLGARGRAVFMGGYFSSKGEHGKGCSYVTTNHDADYHDYSIGFRCCVAPRRRPDTAK
jgi:sulfatase modifying factor 1